MTTATAVKPAASTLAEYEKVVGHQRIDRLQRLAGKLKGKTLTHVNSTKEGGGVAEILNQAVPLLNELGVATDWQVIEGNPDFFKATKAFHNGLQGNDVVLTARMREAYQMVNEENAKRLRLDADVIFIHDPQPAALIQHFPRRGKWLWRCHIDASRPNRAVWKFLRQYVARYDASVFSMPAFAQSLPHPQYIVHPSIDPLSDKNRDLSEEEVKGVMEKLEIPRDKPLVLQVSRFDRFKDPLGVVKAFQMVRQSRPCRLVLAGGGASDDPEGLEVLAEVKAAVGNDPDIHILLLPPDSHFEINALQRAANVVVQKSLKEGFGLTVTEALWKGKPVVGGATGGITLQVHNYHTGFQVHSPEGAAYRIRYLLSRPESALRMGKTAREFVRDHFLITRQVQDYMTLMLILLSGETKEIFI
jgi:trehalose synthase